MPKLSLCMIARDEESLLARCLASVKGIVDEIVLVDTGSRDRTADIARDFGARVVADAWSEDFSAARNAGLTQVTGDWILVLDADEILLPGGREAIAAAMAGPHGAYLLPLENLVGSGDAIDPQVLYLLRLFRAHPAIRYRGRVHEQVTESLEALGLSIGRCEARIRHDGYLDARIQERGKHRRNLSLLDRMLADAPNDAYARYQRGKTLLAMERLDEAKSDLRDTLRLLAERQDAASYAFYPTTYLHLAAILDKRGHREEALGLVRDGLTRLPKAAELWLRAGLLERELNRPDEAIASFEAAMREATTDRATGVDMVRIRYRALLASGELIEARGDHEGAAERYRMATEIAPPAAYEAWLRLAVLLMQSGDLSGAISAYEAVVERDSSQFSAYVALGTLYFEKGMIPKAFEALTRADALRPGLPDVTLLLQMCRQQAR